MRILLTGATGQLGSELRPRLAALGEIIAPTRADFDLARPDTLADLVTRIAPDLIVNPAAYTAVDLAETEPDLAHTINADAPFELAACAQRLGIPLLHFSTDYVFDGAQRTPYRETDATHPLNVYGASKRAGELAVAAACAHHLILRSGWIVSTRGRNFLTAIRARVDASEPLRVVNDQFGTPNSACHLAAASVAVLTRWLAQPERDAGLYHLSASGEASWFDLAQRIARQRVARTSHHTKTARHGAAPPYPLAALSTPELARPAARPAYACLDSEQTAQRFDVRLPPWQVAIDELLNMACDAELPQETRTPAEFSTP